MAEQSNIQTLINSWNHELASTEEESKDFCLRQCKIAETMLNTEPQKADGIAAALIHFAQHNIGDHDSKLEIEKEALLVRGATLYRLTQYQEALTISSRALDIAKEIGDIKGQSFAMNTMGAVAIAQGDYESALHQHTESLALRKSIHDDALMATSLMNIGNVYLALGDLTNALEYFMQSLLLREKINDEHGIGVSLSNIGNVYGIMGDADQAVVYLQKSLASKIATNNKQGQVQTLCDLATQYLSLGDVTKARDHANVALQVAIYLGNIDGEASALHLLGLIETDATEYKYALEYFTHSLTLRTKSGNTRGYVETVLAQCDVFIYLQQYKEALATLDEIQKRTESLQSLTLLRSFHRQYSTVHEHLKNYELALHHARIFHELHERVFNQHSAERLRNLQILHQVESTKKENEIYRLRNIELAHAYQDADTLSRSLSLSNAELNEAIEQLEIINKEKNDIFGIVVHDLRNPLTAITLNVSGALSNSPKLSNGEMVQIFQKIKKNTDRMTQIIKKMVDLFTMESGAMKPIMEQHDLATIINKVVDNFVPVANEKNISIHIDASTQTFAEVDMILFEEIIDNVLSNAIKFSPNDSKVNIKIFTVEQ
ncbi:MAG: tetratricopeptide repeat protein [Candidatus Kapaibacterium sp.]|jgi:signal transduction histidine kinase